MSPVLTTASVPDEHRLTYWRQAVEQALVPVSITLRGRHPFEGRIVTHRVGVLRVTAVEADAYRVRRTAAHITRTPEPLVAIALQMSGTTVLAQDGRQVVANPGDLFVWDTTRPYSLDFPERFSTRVVHMPRHMLVLPDEDLRGVTGTVFNTDQGCAAVLMPLLATVVASAHAFSPAAASGLANGLTDVFAALVAERTEDTATEAGNTRNHLVQRVRDHIDENLADPALSPESVAKANHISVRYLHRLFEGEGVTVSRLIQRRRLEECARELTRGSRTAPTVSSIAQRWGFVNPTHFSRVFRGVYGLPPREWRTMRLATGDTDARPARTVLIRPPRLLEPPAQPTSAGRPPGRSHGYGSGLRPLAALDSIAIGTDVTQLHT
ncbi:AraC-like DNA-binding protein [Streptomyces aurantiacus]|uniref:AraC-like ligand-binding domain-containing protein n=1 Tax=Streptomyces aurantiacus TaxID=47760 RepID=UPI00278F7ECD|nr:helix-turn-helix domain-containing protein [Streptomyces aurantiacus]MDQ0774033.1 AraC-like DNA-binding protein [Streptomyces aurantiacus]